MVHNFINITESEVIKACKFKFSSPNSEHRLKVEQLMPVGNSVRYCIIIKELFMKIKKKEDYSHFKDFKTFFQSMNLRKNSVVDWTI